MSGPGGFKVRECGFTGHTGTDLLLELQRPAMRKQEKELVTVTNHKVLKNRVL